MHIIFYVDSKVLVPVPGCILSCSLRPHPTLAKASHLIPPKVIISYDDIIPGLIPTNVPEGIVILHYQLVTTNCTQ